MIFSPPPVSRSIRTLLPQDRQTCFLLFFFFFFMINSVVPIAQWSKHLLSGISSLECWYFVLCSDKICLFKLFFPEKFYFEIISVCVQRYTYLKISREFLSRILSMFTLFTRHNRFDVYLPARHLPLFLQFITVFLSLFHSLLC